MFVMNAPQRELESLSALVRRERKIHRLTQRDLADRAGVGLRFVRELEADKKTLRLDKINDVLSLFGYEAGAVPMAR